MAKSFLGRGWKFPVRVDSTTGRIKLSEYEEDIFESIKIILATSKGERIMRPDFGGGIHDFVFGLTDTTTLKMLEGAIRHAITVWEPRVDNVDVGVEIDRNNPERLLINIHYQVRSTNNLFNLVYPFFINEGSK